MFKVIDSHVNYSVSTDGVVKNNKTGRILKQDLSRRYPSVRLGKFGGAHSVHRLVAQAFIDNHSNKEQVNHIDGDKTNNHVSNLEWCTAKENIRHAQINGLMRIKTYPIFRRQKICDDSASELCEAFIKGVPVIDIAKHHKVNRHTVYAILRKSNINRREYVIQ